jgi:hypothetical protein
MMQWTDGSMGWAAVRALLPAFIMGVACFFCLAYHDILG